MLPSDKSAIVRHVTKNDLYRHISGNTYRLIRTGKDFEVEPDKAKEIFRLNLAATEFCNRNKSIELLIEKLGLRIYHND